MTLEKTSKNHDRAQKKEGEITKWVRIERQFTTKIRENNNSARKKISKNHKKTHWKDPKEHDRAQNKTGKTTLGRNKKTGETTKIHYGKTGNITIEHKKKFCEDHNGSQKKDWRNHKKSH